MIDARRGAALLAERLDLEEPAFWLYERLKALGGLPERLRPGGTRGDDGLALPPPLLMTQVTGSPFGSEFLAQGRRAAATIGDTLERSGRRMEDFRAVLDFGCGCGRVMRHWAHTTGPAFFGSDYNEDLVRWCRSHLGFATFHVNRLSPPTPFEDEQFDFVYALSVFTHWTEPLQHEWIAELRRLIAPGGLLLMTTRGDAHRSRLTSEERLLYDSGHAVIRYGALPGSNLCAALHPAVYVRERLAIGFEVLSSETAAMVDGQQDVHLLRRLDD